MTALENTQPEGDARAGGERIAKVIARSGLCSRRDAERMIAEGRVAVNGVIIQSPALDVGPRDLVSVDGNPLPKPEPPRLWRYYKPKGRVTTHKDPEGRPTVFEALPEGLPRLISVGRLDFNTEGLLLLTNDGELARHLELPSTGWARRYRVRAHGKIDQAALDELANGITLGGVRYGPIEASLEREQGDNVWILLSIREGKNREVRRVMEHLGLEVNRLIRVSFGPFMLGELEPGQVEEVKTRVLRDQLGPRLSKQLGLRREPLREHRSLPPSRSRPTYLRRKPMDDDAGKRHEPPPQNAGQDKPARLARPEKRRASQFRHKETTAEAGTRPKVSQGRGATSPMGGAGRSRRMDKAAGPESGTDRETKKRHAEQGDRKAKFGNGRAGFHEKEFRPREGEQGEKKPRVRAGGKERPPTGKASAKKFEPRPRTEAKSAWGPKQHRPNKQGGEFGGKRRPRPGARKKAP